MKCPKCGGIMEGDYPNKPWWIEWICLECDYRLGEDRVTETKEEI